MPYPNEHSCRITEPSEFQKGSFRRISEGKLNIIIGKKKGQTKTSTQAFRYPKDKWSVNEARSHCRDHNGKFEPASNGKSAALSLTYLASVHSVATGKEKHLATFYIMNTTKNLNGWAVTDKALEDALPTLLNKTIEIESSFLPEGHDGEFLEVGKFIEVEKPDGYALGTTEITNPKAWQKLCDGEIGPISVVISGYQAECSLCGEPIETQEDAENHSCIKQGKAHEQITSFVFEKIDFVETPAFPQAGTIHVKAAEAPTIVRPLTYCAAVYLSQSFSGQGEGSLKTQQKKTKEKKKLSETEPTVEQRIEALEKQVAEILAKLKEAQETEPEKDEHGCIIGKEKWDPDAGKCVPIENPETATLRKRLEEIEAEKHEAYLTAAVDARYEAELATDKTKERGRLKDLPDNVLKAMAADAKQVAQKLAETRKATGPRFKYDATAAETDGMDKAKQAARQRLNLPIRKEAKT